MTRICITIATNKCTRWLRTRLIGTKMSLDHLPRKCNSALHTEKLFARIYFRAKYIIVLMRSISLYKTVAFEKSIANDRNEQ